MSEERLCLNCAKDLKGRSDKKFCDDQCRSTYNRASLIRRARYIKEVNTAMKKNRQILIDMNTSGKTRVLYRDMLSRGFDFGYFTSILKTRLNNYYYFCYEMGYLPLDRDYILLVKKEDHQRMETVIVK